VDPVTLIAVLAVTAAINGTLLGVIAEYQGQNKARLLEGTLLIFFLGVLPTVSVRFFITGGVVEPVALIVVWATFITFSMIGHWACERIARWRAEREVEDDRNA